MSGIVENYEVKARFQDESEAELIREKLEKLVTNILAHVEKRDERFQNTLVKSGSVYEGTKVCTPNEFDFMIRINPLADKPSLRSCTKGDGYVKLVLDEDRWKDFKDEEGFFSPNLLSRHFKNLIIESIGSISKAEIPEGLAIERASKDESEGRLWLLYSGILGGETNSPSVIYSETHGPATTLDIHWQGEGSYKKLKVKVDLTPTLDYHISKLPVQLAEFPPEFQKQVQEILQKSGFHVVPAGFDVWRISFSVAEKEILATSPEGFRACYKVLKVLRDDVSQKLGWSESLVPSYMLKTVLMSQLLAKDPSAGQAWEKDFRSQTIIEVLELILQGIVQANIEGFFTPTYKLLSAGEHENKLRQCLVEDMLNVMKGFEMAHTREDVEEIKKQVKLLQLIDLLEYLFSCLLRGENPTVVWNMMFSNIDSVPGHPTASKEFDVSWIDILDLDVTDLCPDAYKHLKEIWSLVEDFEKRFLATLQDEKDIELARKYKSFMSEKKRKFETENPDLSKQEVQQTNLCQLITDWILVHIVDKYIGNDDTTLSSVHKILPVSGFRASGKSFFHGVADITMKKGSEEGLALFKQLFKEYVSKIPEFFIMSGVVGCVRHMFLHAKEELKPRLRHITISEEPSSCPELELD